MWMSAPTVAPTPVLGSRVCGAKTLAVEPDPDAMASPRANITLNNIGDRVMAIEAALGESKGAARLTRGLDTVDRIVKGDGPAFREVDLTTLDELLSGEQATLIKLDVEGYESEELAGAARTLRVPAVMAIETDGNEVGVASRLSDARFELVFFDPFERALSHLPVWR